MRTKVNQTNSKLFETVVNGGYCIGCGVCASVKDSPVKIKLDEYGKLQATYDKHISDDMDKKLLSVCPFSNEGMNEDEIGKRYFSDNKHHSIIGYYNTAYAGYAKNNGFRERGSSGGLTSWILIELMKNKIVDAIIHVQSRLSTDNDQRIFSYNTSSSISEIQEGAKSKYYPIELSEVFNLIRNDNKKYAVVGIPCFIKGIRLLMDQEPEINKKIIYCIGMVCGHLKSIHFASLFAWQNQIKPKDIITIDFRNKLQDKNANQYGVKVQGYINNKIVTRTSSSAQKAYGANWGYGFFKYNACDYCDDIFAETADITIGDAWLPRYIYDYLGTNLIITRNEILHDLIKKGFNEKKIHLESLSTDEVLKTQAAGIRHRRKGLSFRLYLKDKNNIWRPQKRVLPSDEFEDKFKKIQRLRIDLSKQSHISFKKAIEIDDFDSFKNDMKPLLRKYDILYKAHPLKRLLSRIYRKLFIKYLR